MSQSNVGGAQQLMLELCRQGERCHLDRERHREPSRTKLSVLSQGCGERARVCEDHDRHDHQHGKAPPRSTTDRLAFHPQRCLVHSHRYVTVLQRETRTRPQPAVANEPA